MMGLAIIAVTLTSISPEDVKLSVDEIVPESTQGDAQPTIISSTHEIPVLTPSLKVQKFRKLQLPNEMQVYIISDPGLPSSAAGLANKDGGWNNPNNALGIAHFDEHMVFMGTKEHPKPSSFDSFLTENGAQMSNAATGSQVTQYAFSVSHDAFDDALGRFADMFTAPLFTEAGLKKEIHAVNQEYEMHKDDDGWRQLFVEKATANPAHPWSRFSIGTLKTLGKVDHKKMKHFFETHYSSNLMSAVIYTVLPLDKAEAIAVKHLGKVPNRNLKASHYDMPLLNPAMVQTAVWQKSLTNTHTLSLKWELPPSLSQRNHTASYVSPDRLLSHVVNYRGQNSIFTQLRNAGLAHALSCGQSDKGFDASLFVVQLSLTPKGFKHWEQAVQVLFEGLAKLRQTGIPQHIFDQMHKMDLVGFQWQQRSSDVFNEAMSQAANLAHTRDFAAYPFLDSVIQEFDPETAMALVETLKPEKVHIYGLSPDYPAGTESLEVKSEPHYHTEWKVQPLDKKLIAGWTAAEPASFLQIPPENPYLPKVLKVSKDLEKHPPVFPKLPIPSKLLETDRELVHVWKDQMFGDPFISAQVHMKTDKNLNKQHGVDSLILVSLIAMCINHGVVDEMQPFVEAGLPWMLDVSPTDPQDLMMTVSGTNTDPANYKAAMKQLAKYLKKVSQGDLLVDEKTFEMLQTSTLHSLQNSLKGSPESLAMARLRHTMNNLAYPVPEQIAAAKRATFASTKAMAQNLFNRTFFTGFFAGQVKPQDAKAVWKSVMAELPLANTEALPKKDFLTHAMRLLPEQPSAVHTHGSSHGNAALLLIDAGKLDCKQREALSVLYKVVPTAFYSDLRTKQQTGYLVQSMLSPVVSHRDVIYFVVQSSQYKPGDLLHRYNTFIAKTLADLSSAKPTLLTTDNFKMIKGAKLQMFKTPNMNVGSMIAEMQSVIDDYDADFHALEKKQKIVQDMQLGDVLAVAKEVLKPENKRRLAVTYTTTGDKLDALPSEFIPFKSSMGKFVSRSPFKCEVPLSALTPAKTPKKQLSSDPPLQSVKHGDLSSSPDAGAASSSKFKETQTQIQ